MCLLAAFCLASVTVAHADLPRVELAASTRQPFVGQQVTLTLNVHLRETPAAQTTAQAVAQTVAQAVAQIEIPWLATELVEWQLPSDQWVCRQTRREGLPVRLSPTGAVIRMEPIETSSGKSYRLEWRFRVKPAAEPITFDPVQFRLGNQVFASSPLTLVVRDLPGAAPPGLFVGVGDLRLEAATEPKEVRLGQDTVLTLTVTGAGDLRAMAWPDLSALEAFRRAFLIEPHTQTWNDAGASRSFRYLLKPRRPIDSVPAIGYVCFDPRLGIYQTRATSPLTVVVKPREPARPVPPYAPGLIPDRLRLVPVDPESLRHERAWPGPLGVLVLVIPPMVTGLVWLLRHRLFPRTWPAAARHWSGLAAETLRKIETALSEDNASGRRAAEGVHEALWHYLRQRFHLQRAEPTHDELQAHLGQLAVSPAAIARFQELRRQCDAARFASASSPTLDALRRLSIDALRQLEGEP